MGAKNSSVCIPALLCFELNAKPQLCQIVSGGFAVVHPNNTLTINAVEGAPLEDFSPEVSTHLRAYVFKTLLTFFVYSRLFAPTLPRPTRSSLVMDQKLKRLKRG